MSENDVCIIESLYYLYEGFPYDQLYQCSTTYKTWKTLTAHPTRPGKHHPVFFTTNELYYVGQKVIKFFMALPLSACGIINPVIHFVPLRKLGGTADNLYDRHLQEEETGSIRQEAVKSNTAIAV